MKRLLSIELIPKTAWYKNVRSTVPCSVWMEIRVLHLRHFCVYCGTEHELNLHEIWQWDDIRHVQKLTGFETVCFLCHNIKHLAFGGIMIEQGVIERKDLVKHYCQVNDCSAKDFERDAFEAMKVWEERSKFVWILDMTYLTSDVMPKLDRYHKWMKENPEEVQRILKKLEGLNESVTNALAEGGKI